MDLMMISSLTVKTPEKETDTPTPINTQPGKISPFTNGATKRNVPPPVAAYRECLKNHAAAIGGHAVDGCGEFMPNNSDELKCAACGCHRNFHRKETENRIIPSLEFPPHHRHHPPPPPPPREASPDDSPSPPPISSSYYPSSAPHVLMSLSNSNPLISNNLTFTPPANSSLGRKRHRTRFTQDQKEKMLGLAERLGWRMQKRDEDIISEFCNEIGVEKGVFKVWMHNNKNSGMNSSGKNDLVLITKHLQDNNNNNHNNNNNNSTTRSSSSS